MKILIKEVNSSIQDSDVKWYLADESLWITSYSDYSGVEKSIANCFGSFNWLYNVNDTLLFEKEDGKFKLAIINLTGKVEVIEAPIRNHISVKKGEIYFLKPELCDYEFRGKVNYVCEKDYLYSCPSEFLQDNDTIILFITCNFGFFIHEQLLVGWMLKKASNHLELSTIGEKTLAKSGNMVIAEYLRVQKKCEEDNNLEPLVELSMRLESQDDIASLAVKECLNNILSFNNR